MSTAVSSRASFKRSPSRDATNELLPHWSEVTPPRPTHRNEPPRLCPAPTIAAVLTDLVSWAADLAVLLTHECPEDRAAIEDVRRYAHAWLAGDPLPDVRIEDVLTTAATLLSAIDLDLGRTTSDRASRSSIAQVAA